MTAEAAAPWDVMSDEQRHRWTTVLTFLTTLVPPGGPSLLVDGADERATLLADRLAATLRHIGRRCVRLTNTTCTTGEDAPRSRSSDTVVIADGRWRVHVPAPTWHLTIWVRSAPTSSGNGYRGDGADVVIDLHEPNWPVIRHIDEWFAPIDAWYRSETPAFFAARAGTWDTKFGEDLPAYAAAVTEARLPAGGAVVDVGCGTGRALAALRDAVGPAGTVFGVDLTPQMLTVARARAFTCRAGLLLADARRLPIATAAVDAVFAAGLVMHLPQIDAGLRELARITRPGGRLVLFHPSGRAALAARHGRIVRPDEPLGETPLGHATERTGWHLTHPPHRFLAIASRR